MVVKKLPKKKVTKKVTKKKIIAKSSESSIKKRNPDFNEKLIKDSAKHDAKTIIEEVDDGTDIYRIDLHLFMQHSLMEAGIRLYNEKKLNKAKKIYISELKKKLPKELFRVLQTSIE